MKKKERKANESYMELEELICNTSKMRYSAHQQVSIIILSILQNNIKGRLGFTIKLADEKFYFNAKAIAYAIRLNRFRFYNPQFKKLDLLDKRIAFYKKSLDDIMQGGLGKVTIKNTAKRKLKYTLDSALDFINELARDNRMDAVTIITGANLIVHKKRVVNKKELEAVLGRATGEIILKCIAEKVNGKYVDATYMWQYSIDKGKTWEPIDPTHGAKVVVTGMLPRISTLFRTRSKTSKKGLTAWCNPVEIVPQ